jgi:hypothetical protein
LPNTPLQVISGSDRFWFKAVQNFLLFLKVKTKIINFQKTIASYDLKLSIGATHRLSLSVRSIPLTNSFERKGKISQGGA